MNIEITKEEYFYFEWLILEKHITYEIYLTLSNNEKNNLVNEYIKFKNKINLI